MGCVLAEAHRVAMFLQLQFSLLFFFCALGNKTETRLLTQKTYWLFFPNGIGLPGSSGASTGQQVTNVCSRSSEDGVSRRPWRCIPGRRVGSCQEPVKTSDTRLCLASAGQVFSVYPV